MSMHLVKNEHFIQVHYNRKFYEMWLEIIFIQSLVFWLSYLDVAEYYLSFKCPPINMTSVTKC